MKEKQYIVDMEKGGQVALYRLKLDNPVGHPIIIAHGTMSSAESVRALAQHLSQLGFDCWIMEWGGHGKSVAFSKKQNFEYPALNDVPTAINTVLKVSGQKKLYWVSHSGGGHLALMHLARKPEYQDKFAGLVTLGAQATDGAMGFKYKSRALFLWGLTRLFGQFPQAIASATVGTEGEPTRLLAQWSKWNINKKWQGVDGFDYMSGLSSLTVPALMLAGSNDDIAPATGCKKFFEAMGSTDKSWLVFSQANGHSKDFTHGQLIRGSAAQQDVYPHISDWIIKRNSQP